MHLPATVHGSFQGTAQAFKASQSNAPPAGAAALMAVYVVLGILYESHIHPVTILSTFPRQAWARCWPCCCAVRTDVISFIGIILLIGIVKKNAILMIDFALEAERRRAGPPRRPSTRPACCASGRS